MKTFRENEKRFSDQENRFSICLVFPIRANPNQSSAFLGLAFRTKPLR